MGHDDAEAPLEPHKSLHEAQRDAEMRPRLTSGSQAEAANTKIDGAFMEPYVRIEAADALIPITVLSEMGKGDLRKLMRKSISAPERSEEIRNVWRNLLATARSPLVTDKHLTATCNVLCVLIQNAFPTSNQHGEVWASPQDVWHEGFGIVSRAFAEGKTKPALQLLEALMQAYCELPDLDTANSIWEQAVESMLVIIFLDNPRTRIKEALIVLTRLLRGDQKDVANFTKLVTQVLNHNRQTWMRRLNQHDIDNEDSLKFANPAIGSFVLSLFWARDMQESRNAAAKMFSSLLKVGIVEPGSQDMSDLGRAMEVYISSSVASLDEFANDIFPTIFTDVRQFDIYLQTYETPMSNTRLALFLATLQLGRARGYVEEIDLLSTLSSVLCNGTEVDGLGYEIFALLLKHLDASIRNRSYRLLTWSSKTTAPIPSEVLVCVADQVRYLHNEGDPHYRGDILSTTSKLVGRLYGSAANISMGQHADARVQEYIHFLDHLIHFLEGELSPSASYQRHIIALQSLRICMVTAPSIPHEQTQLNVRTILIQKQSFATSLLALLLDPFEDVREASMDILQRIYRFEADCSAQSSPALISSVLQNVKGIDLMERIESLAARSCRGDHADGLGRLYGLDASANLLRDLIRRLESFLLSRSVFELPSTFPLHGMLLGVMYGMTDNLVSKNLRRSLMLICSKIWLLVQPQLCIDSPEFASEETANDSNVGPKDILAYSWRALRDSSLLLRSMLEKLNADDELYTKIGNLCLEQLITLRHRGAFSTVAQTFTICCQLLTKRPQQTASALRSGWHQSAIQQINDQSTQLTRRSAGLPATMACVLNPEDSSSVSEFIFLLTGIAKERANPPQSSNEEVQEPSFPQVHALNCLREIMLNARFRNATEKHVSSLLELSATCFSVDAWAIRNCGLMLFQACVVRLERQHDPSMSANAAAWLLSENACHPVNVAIRLLKGTEPSTEMGSTSIQPESVWTEEHSRKQLTTGKTPQITFAALDLVMRCRLAASPSKKELTRLISNELGNPIWAIREQAARLIADSVGPGNEIVTVSNFMAMINVSGAPNQAHGLLLCCRKILQISYGIVVQGDLESIISALCSMIEPMISLAFNEMAPHAVRAEFAEICNDALGICLKHNVPNFQGIQVLSLMPRTLVNERDLGLHGLETPDALFRRAMALNMCLGYLLIYTDQPQRAIATLCRALDACAASDANVANYLLEKLDDLSWSSKSTLWPEVLLSVIQLELADEAMAQARSMLSRCISRHAQKLSHDFLHQCTAGISDNSTGNRDLFNATTRLHAALLARIRCLTYPVADKPAQVLNQRWIARVKLSAKDKIDEPTRWTAAISISLYLQHHKKIPTLISTPSDDNLEILVVLYDLVRDDDEDIRDIAARTISSLLQSQEYQSTNWLPLMPFAAGKALSRYLQEMYEKSSVFADICLLRIVGADCDIVRYCDKNPVSILLRRLLQDSNSLFAEEKQNLYIDDIQETELWSEILRERATKLIKSAVLQSCQSWVYDGLLALEGFLGLQESTTTSPFDSIIKLEVLTLFVRVIRLAGALLNASQNVEHDILLEILQGFRRATVNTGIHERVLDALSWALPE